jgi:uncharacterized membrane protein
MIQEHPEGLRPDDRTFPASAGILLGLGLGGFFDGIVLHQVLQWHHMLTSAGYPADSVPNLEVNVFWDGVFHLSTYVFTALGLFILWRHSRRPHRRWPARMLLATLLIGFGSFNLVEGIVDHHILGIHHVRGGDNQTWWDIGFLIFGALLVLGGWLLQRSGKPIDLTAGTDRPVR